MTNFLLETERLWIHPVQIEDAPFVLELLNSAGWVKYIGERNVRTIEEAENYIRNRFLKHFEAFGFGVYSVKLRDNQESIGICTLLKKPYLDKPDIGYAFLEKFSGKGYAFEATKAVYDYAKSPLNIVEILAVTTLDNERSIKLLNKLGFHFDKNIFVENEEVKLFTNK